VRSPRSSYRQRHANGRRGGGTRAGTAKRVRLTATATATAAPATATDVVAAAQPAAAAVQQLARVDGGHRDGYHQQDTGQRRSVRLRRRRYVLRRLGRRQGTRTWRVHRPQGPGCVLGILALRVRGVRRLHVAQVNVCVVFDGSVGRWVRVDRSLKRVRQYE